MLMKNFNKTIGKQTRDFPGCRVVNTCKGKGKVIPLQARRGPEGGWRYSSTLP